MPTFRWFIFSLLCSVAGCSQVSHQHQASIVSSAQLSQQTQDMIDFLETEPEASHLSPAYPDLWTRIRVGFQLHHNAQLPAVAHYVTRYQNDAHHILELTQRAEPYMHLIVDAIERRGMPLEIALLPMVESAFNPFAESQWEASGIWQIIPSTGQALGLRQDKWYDGRKDIVASTEAALDYLDYLQQRFDHDWLLALAAYNSGEGTVARAIIKNKLLNKPTDYANLHLPPQTKDYIPKLLALANLIQDPTQYQLALPPLDNAPYLKAIDLDYRIDMGIAADLAQLDLNTLYRLNPGYQQWSTHPEPDGPHYLLLPIEHAHYFETNVGMINNNQALLAWRPYVIQRGDTLKQLAAQFHTTIAKIMRKNFLKGDIILAGDTLRLPQPLLADTQYHQALNQCFHTHCQKNKRLIHTVKHGESLWSIAKRYHVKPESIASWNTLSDQGLIKPGQPLLIKVRQA